MSTAATRSHLKNSTDAINTTESLTAEQAIFALKVSTLLKLTGFDPKKIELEMFRKMALLVFMRAYKVIYNEEEVPGVSKRQMDFAMSFTVDNAQSFMDCLHEKTKNDVLTSFSAGDLVNGTPFCVGLLVGLLYNELQAFILETMNGRLSEKEKRFRDGDMRFLAESVSASDVLRKDPPSVPSVMEPRPTAIYSDVLVTFQNTASKSERVAATTAITAPAPLTAKASSVRFEEPVASSSSAVAARPLSVGSSYFRGSANRSSTPAVPPLETPPSSPARALFLSLEKTSGGYPNPTLKTKSRGATSRSPYLSSPFAYPFPGGTTAGSPALKSAVQSIQETLLDMEVTVDYDSALKFSNRRARPLNQTAGPPPPEKGGGLSRQGRTLKSIQDYTLQRRRERTNHKPPTILVAHFYGAYNFLEPLDVLITIEHCHSCDMHSFSLRHTETDYSAYADHVFKTLVQELFDSRVCCRVGIYRFLACVRPEIGQTREARIGAFEVQVAYRHTSGRIDYETLHSKLLTHKWPSKMPLKSKLKAFINRAKMSHFSEFTPNTDTAEVKAATVEGGLAPYVVGLVEWHELAVSEEGWSYPEDKNRGEGALLYEPCAERVDLAADAAAGAGLQSVCWLYDTRPLAACNVRRRAPVGSTVLVSRVPSVGGGSERHRLVGVVDSYPTDPQVAMNSVLVRLRYFSAPTLVQASGCRSYSEDDESDVEYEPDGTDEQTNVPCELSALLLLALSRFGTAGAVWRKVSRDDVVDRTASSSVCTLTTTSFFQQLRLLAYDLERIHCLSNSHRITHPISGEQVDLQLSYSPRSMRWIEGRFGSDRVDVLRLEQLLTSDSVLAAMSYSPARAQHIEAQQLSPAPAAGRSAATEETQQQQ